MTFLGVIGEISLQGNLSSHNLERQESTENQMRRADLEQTAEAVNWQEAKTMTDESLDAGHGLDLD